MNKQNGYELLRDEVVEEINTRARIYRHLKSGAKVLSLENDDDNKVFGITFRTPPEDSTGVAHIMEHSVLGGSRKFQVKEPFLELVKGSLNTFLNAMTFGDKTAYPVASTNLQDFYNLVDVYLDAVFYPLITPHHLAQEGWHLELDDIEDAIIYKGVVFNEMKGVYSSPDSMLQRYSQNTLFPDNTYGFDSGGDPSAIPDLSYRQFKEFHDAFYHPSNAWIYFYGDDDPAQRLRLLDGYLNEFDASDVDSVVALQSPFDMPRRKVFPYVVDAAEVEAQAPKAMVQLNWLLPEYQDMTQVMALSILSYALVSTPASPLRKALIDSGLGENLTGGGLSTWTRQMSFSVGMKGLAPQNVGDVESLILDTLAQIADQGLEADMIEAAVNSVEFRLRENNTGPYPRGLSLMLSSLALWLHDGDPLAPLRFEEPLAAVKERLGDDPQFINDLVKLHLVDNPHRTTVVMEPDTRLAQRRDEEEKAKLGAIQSAMTRTELQEVIEETATLRRLQQAPNSPEALASLPMLTLEDLDRESKAIPLEVSAVGESEIIYHDLFTNGIVYLDVGFDLHALPQELVPYAGLFGRVLLEMGTDKEDFVKLSQRIGRKTGGISASSFISPIYQMDQEAAWLFLRAKATGEQTDDLLQILHDVLLTTNLDQPQRFKQIVLQEKASQEGGLLQAGHAVVNRRLRARFDRAGWLSEQAEGLDALFFLRRLAERIENDWPSVLEQLQAVRNHLVNQRTAIANVTFDSENWTQFRPRLEAFMRALPQESGVPQSWKPTSYAPGEGLTIPAQVNYVGKGANLYDLGYVLDGSISVISNILRTTWLWDNIRVQGGAYGAFGVFRKYSGVFTYLSYRDPNLEGTLEVYDGAGAFLRHLELDQGELVKGIIGAIGTIDAYQLPDARGFTSLQRYLVRESEEARQIYRDQVLSTSLDDFRRLAEILDAASAAGQVVVLGSGEKINAANKAGLTLSVQKVM